MSVGGRSEHCARGSDTAAAGVVLDHYSLAEPLSELLGDEARGGVGDAAGAERNHEADGLAGVGLLSLQAAFRDG